MGNSYVLPEHSNISRTLDLTILSCRAAIMLYIHYRQLPDHSYLVRAFLFIARLLVAAKLLNLPNLNGKKMMRVTMDESSTHLYERTYQQFFDNHSQPNTIDWVLMINRVIQTCMAVNREELINVGDLLDPLMFMVRFLLTADPYEGYIFGIADPFYRNAANFRYDDNIFTVVYKLWEFYQGVTVPILVAVDN